MNNSYRIVPMKKEHVNGAVEMHLLAFRGFFLASLGKGFLRELYRAAAEHEQTVAYVALDHENQIVGACFGFVNANKFFKEIIKKRWLMFAFWSIFPALRKPVVIPRLFRALTHRGNKPPIDIKPLGALLSTAVKPGNQGLGIAIGLIRSMLDEYIRRGCHAVYFTTDKVNNDRVRGFYVALGCKLLGYYTTPEKRKMCWYLWVDPNKPELSETVEFLESEDIE